MKSFAISTAAVVLMAAPALAGNITPVAPVAPIAAPVIAPPVYDWTGFYVGGQLGYADAETDGAAELDGDGAIGGVRFGYDYDFGRYVLGAGVDYDITDIDLDGAATIENVLRVKARAGLDAGRNLYYATAGYAQAETDNVGDGDGYFGGLGYEVFVTDNVTAGAEVLYHEFEDFDLDGLDASATTAQVSLNYRF